MSKAFTRESDDAAEEPILERASSALPAGAKNYLTPDGADQLREERLWLLENERPRVLAVEEDEGKERKLARIGQRVARLEAILQSAVVTPPPSDPKDRLEVRFGAAVTVRRGGREVTYRIVGVDETDPDEGLVSWMSPIARALMNARVGDVVCLRSPAGEDRIEVVAIAYR